MAYKSGTYIGVKSRLILFSPVVHSHAQLVQAANKQGDAFDSLLGDTSASAVEPDNQLGHPVADRRQAPGLPVSQSHDHHAPAHGTSSMQVRLRLHA